ncbi:hypothetical protein PMIN06_003978 [Paraphaeosphaeria minitans]|uniref:Ulp1 protease family protein n=1 Tax=Paraphaeosphaeria minitans TaxID=565426 RepID=A0A9P6GSH3_9PLEO|nr:Ulp1 protease family protein [Paraphaeosphaeria minitans]
MCKRAAPEEREGLNELLTTRSMERSTATAYYHTRIERFVPTRTLRSLFGLPFRVADCFTRPQKILVQAIFRDGGRKKRIIDAGAADSDTPDAFEESSDDAHPFADYFHTPTPTPVNVSTWTPFNVSLRVALNESTQKSFKASTRTPSKNNTGRATKTNESDCYPDSVWDATTQGPAIKPVPIPTPTPALLDTPSPYRFDRDHWTRRETHEYIRTPPKSSPPASDVGDRLAFNKYIEATYGPKLEQVYNNPGIVDLQLKTLQELHNVADDTMLEAVVAHNENSTLLEGLDDVDGSLEDGASFWEHSMLSFQLTKELIKNLPQEPTPSPSPSPQPISQPPLVAPLTEEEYENLAQIAHGFGDIAAAELVKLQSTTLTSHDFGTLLPKLFNGDAKGWLNDNIINEYLEILVNHAHKQEGYVYARGKGGLTPPVHAFKSQWYTSMIGNPSGTARWARPMHLFGEKLLACNLVLIPICHHSHWRLIAIKPKDRLIEYYDSLHGSGREYTQLAKDWVREVLQKQFVEEEWSISTDQRSEAQANASDCGIFTLLNALVLLRGEEHNRVLVTNGMDDARLRVAATLLAKTATTEMD